VVLPKNAFWLGMKEGVQFLRNRIPFGGNLSNNMKFPLETAAKLMIFSDTMPEKKSKEFRDRLLGSDTVSPILFEIDTTAHFWQLGYDIQWHLPSNETGVKSAEFIARDASRFIEVECKSKTPDAGRKIQRKNFYRLIDEIRKLIANVKGSGTIRILLPEKLPAQLNLQKKILEAISFNLQNGIHNVVLDDGVEISLDVKGEIEVDFKDLIQMVSEIRKPHSEIAIQFAENNKKYHNPWIICVDSKQNDQFLVDIFESIKDANRQFSENYPSLICCFIPEVGDFSELGGDSALANMTKNFFINHASQCVFAVSYISDAKSDNFGIVTSKSMPSITFENPNYDKRLGDISSVYRK
jgi:hypothetical protein